MQHFGTHSPGSGGSASISTKCAECGGDMFAAGCSSGVYVSGISYHSHCWAKREADAAWRRDVLESLKRIEAALQKPPVT